MSLELWLKLCRLYQIRWGLGFKTVITKCRFMFKLPLVKVWRNIWFIQYSVPQAMGLRSLMWRSHTILSKTVQEKDWILSNNGTRYLLVGLLCWYLLVLLRLAPAIRKTMKNGMLFCHKEPCAARTHDWPNMIGALKSSLLLPYQSACPPASSRDILTFP